MRRPVYCLGLLLLCGIAFSKTIYVPDDRATIQGAIDSAAVGDTVLVDPNIYLESIDFDGKNIVVGSLFLTTGDTSYISQTVIQGGVEFSNNEDSTAILSGFTITQGSSRTLAAKEITSRRINRLILKAICHKAGKL